MSKNQLDPSIPLYHLRIVSKIAVMNSAQQNLPNEWSLKIVAENEVDFTIFRCSDLQYITSAIINHVLILVIRIRVGKPSIAK